MSKTFVDQNMLIWEAYPSSGKFGFSENPYIIFNCLTNRLLRPRLVNHAGDEADAQRTVTKASSHKLLELFNRSRELS